MMMKLSKLRNCKFKIYEMEFPAAKIIEKNQ